MLWEVLIYLPTKSLMRFKCVSKNWNSIIRNPKFVEARASRRNDKRNPGLLISRLVIQCDIREHKRLFYAADNTYNLQVCSQLSLKYNNDYDNNVIRVTNIVNGMIGFYWHKHVTKVTLYNIATSEKLDVPVTCQGKFDIFYLGFDHINQVYKVLRDYTMYGQRRRCDICTIGGGNDSSWRRLDPDHIYHNTTGATCINGVLYFMKYYKKELRALDLNTETYYKTIQFSISAKFYMSYIVNMSDYLNCFELIKPGGRLGLIYLPTSRRFSGDNINIWIMDNRNETWTYQWEVVTGMNDLRYIRTLPNGCILLVEKNGWRKNSIPIYVCDPWEKEFKKWITISNDYEFHDCDDMVTMFGYEENILPFG